MTYDQLRADEEKAWKAYQDATADEDRRRVEAGREITRLCASWADLQRRRSGMSPLPPTASCPSDHHWLKTPSTPKTCPTCGKEL